MADSPTTEPLVLGPWKGIDQRGASLDHVSDAMNIDFTPDGAKRRKGRVRAHDLSGWGRISGLFTYRDKSGQRRLAASIAKDGSSAGLAILGKEGTLEVPVAIDWFARYQTYREGDWLPVTEGVSINGHLILAEPEGRLMEFDGSFNGLRLLEAVQGQDAEDGLSGAQSYLCAPPRAKSMTVWRNRLVAAGEREIGMSAEDDPFIVPTSARVGGPNVWPSQSWFSVSDPEDDDIQTVLVHLDRLVILGRRTVTIADEDATQPVARVVNRTRGCLAPASAQLAGKGIIYLSHGRVCEFDGATVEDISEKIWRTLERVNWRAAQGAVSVHCRKKNEYRVWLPVEGSTENTLCAIYNYATKEWKLYSDELGLGDAEERQPAGVTAACSFTDEDGNETIFTGTASGEIFEEEADEGTDNALPFAAYIATYLSPEMRSSRYRFSDARAYCLWDSCRMAAQLLIEGETVDQALRRAINDEYDVVPRTVAHYAGNPVWGPGFGDPPPVDVPPAQPSELGIQYAGWPIQVRTPKYDFWRFPLQQVSSLAQVLIILPGAFDLLHALAAAPTSSHIAPGSIRALELTFERRASRTP